jgi:hypothetical protein
MRGCDIRAFGIGLSGAELEHLRPVLVNRSPVVVDFSVCGRHNRASLPKIPERIFWPLFKN